MELRFRVVWKFTEDVREKNKRGCRNRPVYSMIHADSFGEVIYE